MDFYIILQNVKHFHQVAINFAFFSNPPDQPTPFRVSSSIIFNFKQFFAFLKKYWIKNLSKYSQLIFWLFFLLQLQLSTSISIISIYKFEYQLHLQCRLSKKILYKCSHYTWTTVKIGLIMALHIQYSFFVHLYSIWI